MHAHAHEQGRGATFHGLVVFSVGILCLGEGRGVVIVTM